MRFCETTYSHHHIKAHLTISLQVGAAGSHIIAGGVCLDLSRKQKLC